MKNKDNIAGSEFEKVHFEYQHDGASTIISPFPDFSLQRDGIHILCILVHNLNTLRFYLK